MTKKASAARLAITERARDDGDEDGDEGAGTAPQATAPRTIGMTIIAAVLLLLLNVVGTGVVSYWGGSFSSDEVLTKVLAQDKDACKAWGQCWVHEPKPVHTGRPPFQISAASTSPWNLAFFANMFLIWLLLEPRSFLRQLRELRVWLTAASVTAVFAVITWALSQLVGTYAQGRRVFAYANYDIDPYSFWWQAARLWVMNLLLAALWSQRHSVVGETRDELRELTRGSARSERPGVHATAYANLGAKLAAVFSRLQLDSLLVVAAFAPIAWAYWLYLFPYGDVRYAVLAAIFYVLWFGTWALIGAPFWHAAQRTLAQHFRLLKAIAADDGNDAERWLKLIEASKPLSAGNLIGTGLLALAAIVPPLFELWK